MPYATVWRSDDEYARITTDSKEVWMLRQYYQRFRAFLIRIWHSLRKEPEIPEIIIDGKLLDASDPRAYRMLRRLPQSKARRIKVR